MRAVAVHVYCNGNATPIRHAYLIDFRYPDDFDYPDTYPDARGQRGPDNRGSTVHVAQLHTQMRRHFCLLVSNLYNDNTVHLRLSKHRLSESGAHNPLSL